MSVFVNPFSRPISPVTTLIAFSFAKKIKPELILNCNEIHETPKIFTDNWETSGNMNVAEKLCQIAKLYGFDKPAIKQIERFVHFSK